MNKIIIFVMILLLSSVIVSAGTSDEGVEYDDELLVQFLINDWVYVTIDVKDFSNVTIDYKKDSIEIQKIKDTRRWETYKETSEAILSTLSMGEFQLRRKSEFGTSITGNITKKGFDKLLEDQRVRKIYAKKEFRQFGSFSSNGFSPVLIIVILVLIIISALIIKLLKLNRRKLWKKRR